MILNGNRSQPFSVESYINVVTEQLLSLLPRRPLKRKMSKSEAKCYMISEPFQRHSPILML